MAEYNAHDRVKKMVAAIRSEAKEKADQILDHGLQQYKIEKNKILNQGKDKIIQEFKVKLEQYSIQKRIQRSAKINESRIQKMNTRFELMNKLKENLRDRLKQTIQNPEIYRKILKNLIVQGLIKLMETNVQLRCLQKDHALLESLLPESAETFNALVKKETKKDISVKLSIDLNNFLDERLGNSIGGVVLTCLSGKIVCANTLENRLGLAFQESLPDIREGLFPDLEKREIKKKEVEKEKPKH